MMENLSPWSERIGCPTSKTEQACPVRSRSLVRNEGDDVSGVGARRQCVGLQHTGSGLADDLTLPATYQLCILSKAYSLSEQSLFSGRSLPVSSVPAPFLWMNSSLPVHTFVSVSKMKLWTDPPSPNG
ncbi:hypothetical protein AAY473_010125 [Plecturocebus cupreus]